MINVPNGKVTTTQVLLPLSLVSFVLFATLAFQLTQILHERDALHQEGVVQEKPLEDAEKLRSQLSALSNGTLGLAEKGDKNAKVIVDRLKQAGVLGPDAPPAPGAPAAAARGAAAPPPPPPPAQ